jgi:hypothetical protein
MFTSSAAGRSHVWHDKRGAIAIIGIAAGAVLVLGLWHMVDVGNAIILRNKAQNAADAAAIDNAVWHARGMNVMVGLNLIMALVMSILVAWRVLELLLMFALVVVGIACAFTGFACGALAPLTRWNHWFLSKDPKVSDKVVKICAGINVAEKFVATVVPPFAATHSIIQTQNDYGVDSVIAFSTGVAPPTMISKDRSKPGHSFVKDLLKRNSIKEKVVECFKKPTSPKNANKKPPKQKGPPSEPKNSRQKATEYFEGSWDTGAQRRMGLFFSLPVQEDRLGKLCEMGGNFFDQALPSVLAGRDVSLLGEATAIKGKLFSSVPSLFCAPPSAGSQNVGDIMQSDFRDVVDEQCKNQKEQFKKLPKDEQKKSKYAKPNGSFDWNKCQNDGKKEKKKRYKDPADGRKAQDDMLKCVKPAKTWEVAANGNPFMQSFSSVKFREPAPTPPKKPPVYGPVAPNAPKPASITAAPTPANVRAQAEMYFDCNQKWHDCDSKTMWQLKWKAKLSRVQPISEMLGDAFASALAANIVHGTEKVLAEKLANKLPNAVHTDIKANGQTSYARDWLEAHLKGWLDKGVNSVENLIH